MTLVALSKSRFTTLKIVEMRSLEPDSEDLYERTAAWTAVIALVEFEVRTLTRAIKAPCRLTWYNVNTN